MYECEALIEGVWIKGFEVGIDSTTGLYVFIANDNTRQRHYLREDQLRCGKEKVGE